MTTKFKPDMLEKYKDEKTYYYPFALQPLAVIESNREKTIGRSITFCDQVTYDGEQLSGYLDVRMYDRTKLSLQSRYKNVVTFADFDKLPTSPDGKKMPGHPLSEDEAKIFIDDLQTLKARAFSYLNPAYDSKPIIIRTNDVRVANSLTYSEKWQYARSPFINCTFDSLSPAMLTFYKQINADIDELVNTALLRLAAFVKTKKPAILVSFLGSTGPLITEKEGRSPCLYSTIEDTVADVVLRYMKKEGNPQPFIADIAALIKDEDRAKARATTLEEITHFARKRPGTNDIIKESRSRVLQSIEINWQTLKYDDIVDLNSKLSSVTLKLVAVPNQIGFTTSKKMDILHMIKTISASKNNPMSQKATNHGVRRCADDDFLVMPEEGLPMAQDPDAPIDSPHETRPETEPVKPPVSTALFDQ